MEYILVLAVIVMIALGLLYQFHGAFRAYTQVFFDGYIACLLETGELPGGGGQCAGEMPTFDMKNGKQIATTASGKGESSGAGSGGAGSGKDDKGGSSASGETLSSSSGGGGGSSRIGSIGRSGRPATSRQAAGAGASSKGGVDSLIGTGNFGGSQGFRSDGARSERTRMEFSVEGGGPGAKKEGRPETARADSQNNESASLRRARAIEKLDRKPARETEVDGEAFTFGWFIRILIIGALILAIVILLGGQILQFSRSREKGGGD